MTRRDVRNPALTGEVLRDAAFGGLLAGAALAALETIVTGISGEGPGGAWMLFASVVLGEAALGGLTWTVFLTGLFVHVVLSALFGVLWGLVAVVMPARVRDSYGAHASASMAFGFLLWLVNFQIIARFAYPWFLETNAIVQGLLHVLGYGLPLGLYVCSRLRPVEGVHGREHGARA